MSLDESSEKQEQSHSDFASDQFPAYLLPDGSWRFGGNAKRIAEEAWTGRRGGTSRSPGPSDAFWTTLRSTKSALMESGLVKAMDTIGMLLLPITQAIKAFRQRMASIDEVTRLDSQEGSHIAHDLGVSADELCTLATYDRNAADLLIRRMQSVDLNPSTVPSMVMRDLQRCCSKCTNKVLCVHELEDKPRDPVWPRYCPNEQTLAALAETP